MNLGNKQINLNSYQLLNPKAGERLLEIGMGNGYFIPDLLATKLVEHGTLDANFEDRDGKVVCSQVYEDSRIYKAGLRPGDQLLEFEGEDILTANQFTNLSNHIMRCNLKRFINVQNT